MCIFGDVQLFCYLDYCNIIVNITMMTCIDVSPHGWCHCDYLLKNWVGRCLGTDSRFLLLFFVYIWINYGQTAIF